MYDEVENVAQIFYLSSNCVRGWEKEPEFIKEGFRARARLSLNLSRGLRGTDLKGTDLLMREGQDYRQRPPPGRDLPLDQSVFLAVLSGSRHIYHFVNKAHRRLTGHRALIGRAARDAVPELKEQGNLEILDEVYETGRPYAASRLPLRIRMRRNGPLEDRVIDVAYRPIMSERAERLGVVVEGRDVTGLD